MAKIINDTPNDVVLGSRSSDVKINMPRGTDKVVDDLIAREVHNAIRAWGLRVEFDKPLDRRGRLAYSFRRAKAAQQDVFPEPKEPTQSESKEKVIEKDKKKEPKKQIKTKTGPSKTKVVTPKKGQVKIARRTNVRETELDKLVVAQLKEMCITFNIDTTGTKKQIIARIIETEKAKAKK